MSWLSKALARRPDWAQSIAPDLSTVDYSALRPRRMWEEFRPRATRDPEQNYIGNIAPIRDLFGRAWHGMDWRRSERGYGEGSEEQRRQDRWASPIFRAAILGAFGNMANSFGGPWEGGPGYGTLARAGGGALNNILSGGGGASGMMGNNGGGGSMGPDGTDGMIEQPQIEDPFEALDSPNQNANLATLLSMLQRNKEEPEEENPFLNGYGVV